MKRYQRLSILAALVLAGCPGDQGFAIIPSASAAVPNQVLALALSQAQPAVAWSATAGTVTQAGVFTAPGCTAALPQTITVTAVSGSFTATATVTVSDAVTGITVTPQNVAVAPGSTTTFTATVKSICDPIGTTSALRVKAARR